MFTLQIKLIIHIDKYADLYMKGKTPDRFNKWMAKIEKEQQL